MKFERAIFVAVVARHHKFGSGICSCGRHDPTRSHSEHLADVYEAAMAARKGRV